MLSLTRLDVAGFRSVKEKVSITFPTGAFLIEGDNGSGKTSLFREAAYWLLFGTNLRGEYIDNIVNRESELAEVTGFFDIPGIGLAEATRTRTAAGKPSFTFTSASGQNLLVDTGTTNASLVDPVERLFGMRAATIRASSFYSPTESLMSLKDSARRELLEDAFGLDWIREARDRFAKAYNTSEQHCQRLKIEYATLSSKSTTQRAAAEEFARQALAAKARAEANTTAELERLETELSAKRKALVQAANSFSEIAVLHDQAKLSYNQASTSVQFLQTELNALNSKYATVTATIGALANQRETVAREHRMVSSGARDNCPTCMRPFDASHREGILAELAKKQQDFDARYAELTAKQTAVAAEVAQLNAALATDGAIILQYTEAKKLLDNYNDQRVAAASSMAQIESVIQNIFLPAINRLKQASASGDSTVKSLEASMERAIAEAASAEQAATISKKMLDDETVRLERLSWWKTAMGPKGVRAFVLEGMLPQLSNLASYYLGKMSDYQLAVEITPTRTNKKGVESETIDIRVLNARGIDSYDDCSAGERRKADLALTLALYDTAKIQGGKGLGYLLLDEALDPLSQDAAGSVVALLQELGANGMSVGVVSHSDAVRGHFSTIMRVDRPLAGWTSLSSTVDGVETAAPKVAEPTKADVLREELNSKIVSRMKELGCTTAQRRALIKQVNTAKNTIGALTLAEAEKLHVICLTQETPEA